MTNTIKLNDVEYIKKEEFDKLQTTLKSLEKVKPLKCKRFGTSIEIGILKGLNRIFTGEGEDSISEEEAVEKGALVIDPANVICCIGKTEESKRVLARFISSERELNKMPELKFEVEKEAHGKYSMEYIQKMTEFFDTIGSDAVKITMGLNCPIKMEDNDFALILAPRLESEE